MHASTGHESPLEGRQGISRIEPSDAEPTSGPEALTLDSPALYINRELSLLDFQKRVLEEAQDPGNPLLERIKFLSILSSNLDEFFMVRVSALITQLTSGAREMAIDGQSPSAQLQVIRERVCGLASNMHDLWDRELMPLLERAGIRIIDVAQLTEEQRAAVDQYF